MSLLFSERKAGDYKYTKKMTASWACKENQSRPLSSHLSDTIDNQLENTHTGNWKMCRMTDIALYKIDTL